MKAKSTIPKKGKRLESLKVEPSEQPVAQANDEHLDIDLEDFPQTVCGQQYPRKALSNSNARSYGL